ncbi:trypsin-like serine protease [Bdellovibrio bacteriovorus]|nr:trypsin-like serine protease [Bdellovibrio bacteriovorus]
MNAFNSPSPALKTLVAALAATLALTACSPRSFGPAAEEPSDLSQTGIINGDPIRERGTQAARSVVLVEMVNRHNQPLAFCTGTLIAPQTVLTAGHCFDDSIKGMTGFNIVFTNNYEIFGRKMLVRETTRRGLAYKHHPKFNSTKLYDHDIAIATFDGGIPEGYSTVSIDTDTKGNYSERSVYVYGYGRSKDYTGKPNEDLFAYLGQLRRGVMQIDSQFNRYGDRYWLNSKVPVFICQGDSGGPQFSHENGVLKVIGVNSAVYGKRLPNGQVSCAGIAQATKVAPFAPWIKTTRTQLLQTTTEFSGTFSEH